MYGIFFISSRASHNYILSVLFEVELQCATSALQQATQLSAKVSEGRLRTRHKASDYLQKSPSIATQLKSNTF